MTIVAEYEHQDVDIFLFLEIPEFEALLFPALSKSIRVPLFKFHKKGASRKKREEFDAPLFCQG